jgi:hypothetical protein
LQQELENDNHTANGQMQDWQRINAWGHNAAARLWSVAWR